MVIFLLWRMRLCILVALIISFLPHVINAQVLTLHDAINKAYAHYPLLKQHQHEIEAAGAHIASVNGGRLPSLTIQDQLTAGTDNALQGGYYSLGIVPSTPGSYTNIRNSPNAGNVGIALLKWEFATFGYNKARENEARAQLSVSQSILSRDKYLLTQNLICTYLDWLKKYQLLKVQQENLQRVQILLNAIRANIMSGLKPGVDSSTAIAALADARINYLTCLDNYHNAGITLGTLSGMPTLQEMPDTGLLSKAYIQTENLDIRDTAMAASHPLLDVFKKNIERQLASNQSIAHKYLPKLGLDAAGWVRSSGISPTGVYPDNLAYGMPYSKNNYLIGVTATYNLFDLKHRHDELVEGNYTAEALESTLDYQQTSLNELLAQANGTWSITLEKFKEIPAQLSAARQAYGQQMALYRSGLNTLVELTNAQYSLTQAEANYILVQADLLQLLFIRAGLSGRLDNFLQNFKQ